MDVLGRSSRPFGGRSRVVARRRCRSLGNDASKWAECRTPGEELRLARERGVAGSGAWQCVAAGELSARAANTRPVATVSLSVMGGMGTCSTGGHFRHTIWPMVSEEQIQQWAKEAEVGYDVDELKRRGRGRPGRGAEPMQVVAVRLTAEELEALDAVAVKHEMSRSEAIRAALAHFTA